VSNFPAVSSVLTLTALLQTTITTTVTVHEGTAGEFGLSALFAGTSQAAAGQGTGGENDSANTPGPSLSPVGLAALEQAVNEITDAGVLHLAGANPMPLAAVQALLRALRAGRGARRGAVPAGPVPPAAPEPPAVPEPPEPGAVWRNPEAEPVVPAALVDELAAGRQAPEAPEALSSLLGLGLLAAGLCRPWWGDEEDEKRRRSEDDRRRPLPA
jgi:hypothetical protein